MKTLVIAEKPDMGRNIAAVIEPKAKNKRTHLEGERYIITWAIGHLVGLAEPDRYDDKYKKWNFNDLPIIPESFKLLPNPRTKDQLAVIRELASSCDVLVNACDAGREGQHIFSLIRRHLKLRHPVKRLWISDLTAETIRRGFEELKDDAEYANLTEAARARSEADWLIGMNGSRAFTTKHNELLSVGRVQTPVLALIYDRHKQIEAFASAKFYEVAGYFEQGTTSYRGVWQGERISDATKAEAIAAKVKGKTGAIESYEVKETKEYSPKLYDLTLLQRDANGKHGFSAKKTLDIAQALYEKHKVISYPRTNSNYVNEENIPEMHRILDSLHGTNEYREFAVGANKKLVHKGNRGVCNPAKVEDHHAIMPTMKRPGTLSADERKVYDLIVRRFLSQFYPAAEYKVHTVITLVEQERFKTTIKQLLSLGWKVLLPNSNRTDKKAGGKRNDGKSSDSGSKEAEEPIEETDASFDLNATAPVVCVEAEAKEKETQPPKAYTEGTLLKAMEGAGKQIEDDELRDVMKDSGLGTPATRAATIERLKQVGYIEMQGKRIVITAKGRTAIELIRGAGVELLTSPEMTGHWEKRLNEIARGQASADTFMNNVKRFTLQIVDKVRVQPSAVRTAFSTSDGSKQRSGRTTGASRRSSGGGSGRRLSSDGYSKSSGSRVATGTRKDTKKAIAEKSATSVSTAAPTTIGACPRPGCGGQIFLGRKGYGCSNYKTGCSFVIWKQSLGKSLSDAMVRNLIEKGKTGKLKFKNEANESFDGRIILADPHTGKLTLERL